MAKSKTFKVGDIALTNDDVKLLNQIWRNEYPDCVTFEEMIRRLAIQIILQECKNRKSLNLYKRWNEKKESFQQFIARLDKEGYPTADVEKRKADKDEADREKALESASNPEMKDEDLKAA